MINNSKSKQEKKRKEDPYEKLPELLVSDQASGPDPVQVLSFQCQFHQP